MSPDINAINSVYVASSRVDCSLIWCTRYPTRPAAHSTECNACVLVVVEVMCVSLNVCMHMHSVCGQTVECMHE